MSKKLVDRHADISAFITALHKTKKQWQEEGELHYNAKRYKEALIAYEHVIILDPHNADNYIKRALRSLISSVLKRQ